MTTRLAAARLAAALALLYIVPLAQAEETTNAGSKKAKPTKMVVVTPSDAQWMEVPGPVKGIQVATIRGKFGKGAHATLIKFLADTENPLHTHTNTLRSVVISGTFYQGDDPTSAKDFGPGTYFETPGGWKHVSGCRPGAECLLYEESSGKFDFKPVGGKKVTRADLREVPAPRNMGWNSLQTK